MGIDAQQLCQHVIRPTLDYLGRHCNETESLLLGLATSQSGLGNALEAPQGHGLFRISEQLHQWCWDGYLARDPDLASRVRGLASQHAFLEAPHLELTVNLRYATAIACMLLEAAQQARETMPSSETPEQTAQLEQLLSAGRFPGAGLAA
jgi:hypothetical protein